MNLEQAKETLVDKIEQEFNVYKQQIISNLSKEEIISKAFEISMKDEIRYLISAFTLEKKEVQALLKTDNILDTLYTKSAEGKTNPLETFQDLVKEDISNIKILLPSKQSLTSPFAIFKLSPSIIAVLPTPASPKSNGLFFVHLVSIPITLFNSSSLPITASIFPAFASPC